MEKKETKIIDAKERTLGRVASEATMHLMGKVKPSFERHVYSGFPVKVINASKIRITAKKLDEISHKRYSGYRGGLRIIKGTETAEKKGMKELVKLAIYQMLPGNKLRGEMMKNLKVED
ncbi:uL13 family ribosomal protein [Patescibacteria group bacterium]|nr:uL13 family ribosomal protein [Patescibacteria group bacterium]MBU1728195.1 uL13 family ribosomal protein [Patescibacteria group bacterium]